MSSHITNKLVTSLCLGSCFALISQTQPAQGQINGNKLLLVQQTIIDPLPPPDIPVVIDNQQPLPQVQPGQIQQFEANPLIYPSTENPYQQDPLFPQPSQSNQYSQNFERYFVYVDSSDSRILQRVREIEPGAYIRQYQGRSIIQSGVFSRESNAQQRVRELSSYGIGGARIVSFTNGQQIQTFNPRVDSEPRNKRYYVIIPAKTQELPVIADTIISRTGYSNLVQERQKPFGSHVAVGPFGERGEAERWNKYMQELGFGNARVYFNR